jgi:hypothetical protein
LLGGPLLGTPEVLISVAESDRPWWLRIGELPGSP